MDVFDVLAGSELCHFDPSEGVVVFTIYWRSLLQLPQIVTDAEGNKVGNSSEDFPGTERIETSSVPDSDISRPFWLPCVYMQYVFQYWIYPSSPRCQAYGDTDAAFVRYFCGGLPRLDKNYLNNYNNNIRDELSLRRKKKRLKS